MPHASARRCSRQAEAWLRACDVCRARARLVLPHGMVKEGATHRDGRISTARGESMRTVMPSLLP
jgi:hypothetical protein